MNKRIKEIWKNIRERKPVHKALEVYREVKDKITGE